MNTLLSLLLASTTIALSQLLNKTLSRKGHRTITYTSVTMLSNALVSAPLLFIQPHITSNPVYWMLILFSILVYGLCNTFSFKAYKTADVSVVSIFQRLNIVFIAAFGVVLLKETLTIKAIIGLFLILVSGFTLVYSKSKIIINEGILFSIGAAFFGAVAAVLDKQILNDFSPFSYVFVNNLLIGIVFGLNKHTLHEAPHLIKDHWLRILGTSILNVTSFALVLVVLQKSNVSLTMPIYKSLTLIITVALGILILKERSKLIQKFVGALLGIIGVFLMY